MSKMSEIYITIEEMYNDGMTAKKISDFTGYPLAWVYSVIETLDGPDESSYNDALDGDEASALASAGWGTDEDYGCYGDEF